MYSVRTSFLQGQTDLVNDVDSIQTFLLQQQEPESFLCPPFMQPPRSASDPDPGHHVQTPSPVWNQSPRSRDQDMEV